MGRARAGWVLFSALSACAAHEQQPTFGTRESGNVPGGPIVVGKEPAADGAGTSSGRPRALIALHISNQEIP